ncbi:unnamed protein product [Owenia fusiformis]|uniref:Uncharacterized protein n=1 Tax=Owenia fusiformis TaxID=6347 RepID=A0A8J1UGC0_OWEFU|nr:unnamed protein product [Owenia fusiformis]
MSISLCDGQPGLCLNGGHCPTGNNPRLTQDNVCHCRPGFTGYTCEIDQRLLWGIGIATVTISVVVLVCIVILLHWSRQMKKSTRIRQNAWSKCENGEGQTDDLKQQIEAFEESSKRTKHRRRHSDDLNTIYKTSWNPTNYYGY